MVEISDWFVWRLGVYGVDLESVVRFYFVVIELCEWFVCFDFGEYVVGIGGWVE